MKTLFVTLALLALLATVQAHGHHHDHDLDHHHDHDHQHDHQHHQSDEKYATHDYVLQLTGQNTQEAIDEFPLILIKFYAPWCGHCKTLAPVYTELAKTFQLSEDGEVKIAEVDCTIHKDTCSKFGIRGYPTLKYFIDGQAHQYSGPRTHEALLNFLRSQPAEVRTKTPDSQL